MSAEKNNILQPIKAKDVIHYMTMPGVVPRVREFFGSGFGFIAHLMALIYAGTGLLPANHPYTQHENIGRFGVRHVVAEAANRLIIKKDNIDQIIIFFALLAGFMLLIAQIVILVLGFVFPAAMAGPPAFVGLFQTPDCPPNGGTCEDIAFALMHKVFAIPGLFDSSAVIPPLNNALHKLIYFYNMAILLVGVLIFIYYLFLVVGETAMTGTPFGRRFNHVWAPLRLVVAVGLLVPLNYGFNSAQYITLFSARWGSSFATNAWQQFNLSLSNASGADTTTTGSPQNSAGDPARNNLIALVSAPDVEPVVKMMSVILTCKYAYEQARKEDWDGSGKTIEPYWVFSGENATSGNAENLSVQDSGSFAAAKTWYEDRGHDISIVYGAKDATNYTTDKGQVRPFCGEIKVAVFDTENAGSETIQEAYYNLINNLWTDDRLIKLAERIVAKNFLDDDESACDVTIPGYTGDDCGGSVNTEALLPDPKWQRGTIVPHNTQVATEVIQAREDLIAQIQGAGEFSPSADLLKKGWGGAGIWYNKIAEWNGSIVTAGVHQPSAVSMPKIMTDVENELKTDSENVDSCDRYSPNKADGDTIDWLKDQEKEIAISLNDVYQFWVCPDFTRDPHRESSGNIVFDVMRVSLGLGDLIDIRHAEHKHIHPLAQLSAIGKGIIETSVRNLMGSLAFSFLGGAADMVNKQAGSALFAVSKFFTGFTTIGLTVGFILYYVLPFLPFLYFFFALGKWVKSVFEAMVGVPLWALAHLRVDGNGLPGETASNGYFLIFEIFIRPILCVFGLLAAMAIFTAMARTLNGIWDLVVVNAAGFGCHDKTSDVAAACAQSTNPLDPVNYRYIVDQFFFTVIYTIMLYLMATSSFKLIDQIPSMILRWMGTGAQSFADTQKEDALQGLVQYAAIGGNTIGTQAIQAANKGAEVAGRVVGLPFGMAAQRNAEPVRSTGTTTPPPPTANTPKSSE